MYLSIIVVTAIALCLAPPSCLGWFGVARGDDIVRKDKECDSYIVQTQFAGEDSARAEAKVNKQRLDCLKELGQMVESYALNEAEIEHKSIEEWIKDNAVLNNDIGRYHFRVTGMVSDFSKSSSVITVYLPESYSDVMNLKRKPLDDFDAKVLKLQLKVRGPMQSSKEEGNKRERKIFPSRERRDESNSDYQPVERRARLSSPRSWRIGSFRPFQMQSWKKVGSTIFNPRKWRFGSWSPFGRKSDRHLNY